MNPAPILCCLVLYLAGPLAAESAPSARPATAMAAALIDDFAVRSVGGEQFLKDLAKALREGRVSLEEAANLMEIAERTRTFVPVSLAGGEVKPLTAAERTKAESMLAKLEGEPVPVRPAIKPEPPVSAPPAAPAPISVAKPVAGLRASVVDLRTSKNDDGTRRTTLAVDKGRQHGVAEKQRFQLMRDGKPVVQAESLLVQDTLAVLLLLEASWASGVTDREVKKGEVLEALPVPAK